MLSRLALHQLGPAIDFGPFELGPGVNLITGDNGLGKTFILDVAWWALTGSWVHKPAWPRPESDGEDPPRIEATVDDRALRGEYRFDTQDWRRGTVVHSLQLGPARIPSLVLYFRMDGRFALWDPAQHYWRRSQAKGIDHAERPEPLSLTLDELWNNISAADGKSICRGLIEDWVTWQQTKSGEWAILCKVLECLSPSREEKLLPGEPMRVWLDDKRMHPTLELPYGRTPVTLASAGMQRVLMLAYLLVWAWHGHLEASKLLRQAPTQRLVILFDEPETHLHPQWQRRLLPALLTAIAELDGELHVQTIVCTHSPLVLASMEPYSDQTDARLFTLSLSDETKLATASLAGITDFRACMT